MCNFFRTNLACGHYREEVELQKGCDCLCEESRSNTTTTKRNDKCSRCKRCRGSKLSSAELGGSSISGITDKPSGMGLSRRASKPAPRFAKRQTASKPTSTAQRPTASSSGRQTQAGHPAAAVKAPAGKTPGRAPVRGARRGE
jgi:hypothetical protein